MTMIMTMIMRLRRSMIAVRVAQNLYICTFVWLQRIHAHDARVCHLCANFLASVCNSSESCMYAFCQRWKQNRLNADQLAINKTCQSWISLKSAHSGISTLTGISALTGTDDWSTWRTPSSPHHPVVWNAYWPSLPSAWLCTCCTSPEHWKMCPHGTKR